ncbi:unnamed protein product, partial [Rotaria socialis]
TRYNNIFGVISGDTVEDWKGRLSTILKDNTSSDVYNFDVTESTDEDVVVQKDMCLDELDKVLNHLTIGDL